MSELNSFFHIPIDLAYALLIIIQQLVFRWGSHRSGLPSELSSRIATLFGGLRMPKQSDAQAKTSG